jgi:membrane-associated phospholipid phosphatase
MSYFERTHLMTSSNLFVHGFRRWSAPFLLLLFLISSHADAGLDHALGYDKDGLYSQNFQTGLEFSVIAVEVTGALWLGNDDPLGHTFWQTIDSSAIAGISSTVLKFAFSRARPYQGDNPNLWFRGSCCQSFPSGEVTLQASFVTPFIADYAKQNPWVWSLEFLPVWDAYARLKSQAHWLTDVIAGWALGTGLGYWSATRATPISVQILPGGLSVGFSKRF